MHWQVIYWTLGITGFLSYTYREGSRPGVALGLVVGLVVAFLFLSEVLK
jgi:hypothetical protein